MACRSCGQKYPLRRSNSTAKPFVGMARRAIGHRPTPKPSEPESETVQVPDVPDKPVSAELTEE